jgi:hypothetical protein
MLFWIRMAAGTGTSMRKYLGIGRQAWEFQEKNVALIKVELATDLGAKLRQNRLAERMLRYTKSNKGDLCGFTSKR